jgi:hypothetical protein
MGIRSNQVPRSVERDSHISTTRGNKMLRFYYIIFTAIIFNNYYLPLMWYMGKHTDKYSEEACYKLGRRYLLFPEGGYTDNKNRLLEFHPGSFKIPLKAKCPIIPIAIYDSYKPFTINSLRRVTTPVHYLEPILYKQYAKMSTWEIRDLVYERISNKIAEIEGENLYIESKKAL